MTTKPRLHLRILSSLTALGKLLWFHPRYLILALGISVLFYEIIFWSLNFGLINYLLTSPYLSLGDKFGVLVSSYTGIFNRPYSGLAIMLFIVSLLQGVVLSALVYIIRKERQSYRNIAKNLTGAGLVGSLSAIGLGCAACGTSLVMPLITFFFATSSAALVDKVGFYSIVISLVIVSLTVYLVGYQLSFRLELPSVKTKRYVDKT